MLPTHYHTFYNFLLRCSAHNIVEYSTIECKVPRELLLHTDQLMPPLEIGFERFEENELDNATIPEQ